MPKIDDEYNVINNIILSEQSSAPTTPPSGKHRLYVSASGLSLVNSGGIVNDVGGGHLCNGRLTLTSGVPVTTADAKNAETLYFTPFRGDKISTFSGTSWTISAFTEKSLSLSGYTSGSPYDIFIVDGTLSLEGVAWTSASTRATSLVLQNGVYCKDGALTRRYLGTICASGSGVTEDSVAKRFVWNYYNRVNRYLYATDGTDSWDYTLLTWRASNNNTTSGIGRFEIVLGVSEDIIDVYVFSAVSVTGVVYVASGVGIDSTSVNSAQMFGVAILGTGARGMASPSYYKGNLAAGYHYIQRLEISEPSGVTTWLGDSGVTYQSSGMIGSLWA